MRAQAEAVGGWARGALCLLAVLLFARPAAAVDRRTEAAAKDALRRAQAEHAAQANDRAETRLQRAEHACGPNRCTKGTRAAVLRDLGAVQLLRGEADAAAYSWEEALKLDPKIDLNPAYESPEIRSEWDAAREQGGPQPTGDFVHKPARAEAVNTPLPVYVEYTGDSPPTRVVLKYKGTGMSTYDRVELTKMGNGWGGLVPCGAVTRGTMHYYVQGFDANGEPTLSSGDPKHPFSVVVRSTISGEAPSLPGQSPPAACVGEQAPAEQEATKPPEEGQSGARFRRFWVGLAVSIDVVSLPVSNDSCLLNASALPVNSAGYYCTNSSGGDFPTRATPAENATLVPGNAGNIGGGVVSGNIRLLATFDYAATKNILVGGRFGLVLHNYPGAAASRDGRGFSIPLHFEARGTYLFGADPLANAGFSPFVFGALGVAPFSEHITVQVAETGMSAPLSEDAWLIRGPYFLSAGGGLRYAFVPAAAVMLSLKLTGAFGSGGFLPLVTPELGTQFGF